MSEDLTVLIVDDDFRVAALHTAIVDAVRELEADPAVTLDFQSRDSWITLQGDAELHRDKALFADHWTKDLDRWFQDGIDTPGLTLIQVRARLAEVNGRMGEGRVDLT